VLAVEVIAGNCSTRPEEHEIETPPASLVLALDAGKSVVIVWRIFPPGD